MSREGCSVKMVADDFHDCDICKAAGKKVRAEYDACLKAAYGSRWAWLCGTHFNQMAIGLGTGFGQKLTYPGTKAE